MVILIQEKMKEYLMAIHRDQSWLARKFGVTKGYISVIVNGKCKIPLIMIERLLLLTGMRFEDLFYFNGTTDRRTFFGRYTDTEGEMQTNEEYKKNLDKKQEMWLNVHNGKRHKH